MTASWKNKLVGAIATGAIVAGLFPMAALGVGASVLDSTATTAVPAGPGYSLTINGLDKGDTADYYQIITQDFDTTDPEHIGTQQWKLHANVDKDGDGVVDGTEKMEFGRTDAGGTKIKGLRIEDLVIADFEDNGEKVTSDTRVLTPAMADAIATAISNNASKTKGNTTTITVGDSKKIEVGNVASGMYMFVAVPGPKNTTTLYKPIFVSADYYNNVSKPDDNTHQLDLTVNEKGQAVDGKDYPADYVVSADDHAQGVFKRSPIEIDKKSGQFDKDGNLVDLESDLAVGDTVHFQITVPVPTYSKNYKAPQFYITDTLTDGLKLNTDSIKVTVKNGGSTVSCAEDTDYKIYTNTDVNGAAFKDGNGTTIDGFAVKFFSENPNVDGVAEGEPKQKETDLDGNMLNDQDGFLYTVAGAPTCTITYEAVVTETNTQKFAQQINQMDNTAKLTFSTNPNYYDASNPEHGTPPTNPNNPNPNEPTEELEDKTRHYTFDIDANIFGKTESYDEGGNPTHSETQDTDENNTSEIRKTWIDASGKVIQTRETGKVIKGGTEESGKKGEYGWLEGAEFKLMKTHSFKTLLPSATAPSYDPTTSPATVVGDSFTKLKTPEEIHFDPTTHVKSASSDKGPKSDANGYIAMKGLDAGVYELTEVKAPLGYSFNPNITYYIVITPTYVQEPEGTTDDGGTGTDQYDLMLTQYEVKICTKKLDDKLNFVDPVQWVTTTSLYKAGVDSKRNPISFLNSKGQLNIGDNAETDENGNPLPASIVTNVFKSGENTAMVVNQKLGLLPATGGSGIIFYLGVGGAVAALASFLLSKTKEEDPLA